MKSELSNFFLIFKQYIMLIVENKRNLELNNWTTTIIIIFTSSLIIRYCDLWFLMWCRYLWLVAIEFELWIFVNRWLIKICGWHVYVCDRELESWAWTFTSYIVHVCKHISTSFGNAGELRYSQHISYGWR